MRREPSAERPDWRARVEALGFDFHTIDGEPYWREDACYRFSARQVDELEAATNELHALCLDAIDRIVAEGRYEELGLDEQDARLAELSWRAGEPTLYGRMDFSYDGRSPPKLLEYNADTPTALFEAAVVQWHWLEDTHPDADQFNSIHERLIARWRELGWDEVPVHFAADDESPEDRATAEYLRDTATQAGLSGAHLDIREIGWNGRAFVDLAERPIRALFKLYPWEWLLRDAFAAHVHELEALRWLEPPWKMLLSNKSVLPLLWAFNPGHPNLLPASARREGIAGPAVRKPRFGREGQGVVALAPGADAPASDEPCVYQALHPLPEFGGRHALVGSWVIGHEAAGIGMREDRDPITRNTSAFVPHWFD
jgi:glutathionylspermidine synthase